MGHQKKSFELDVARREVRINDVPVPIGGRAFAILLSLVRADGELVTKDALLAEAWPKAIVEENLLQVHISAIRKALGAERQLLKTVSGRGYRLLGAWSLRSEAAQASAAAGSSDPQSEPRIHKLPGASADLLGRDSLLDKISDLVRSARLVTLTGPGGIGKTVLAIAAAWRAIPAFQHDVTLIQLASISEANHILSTLVTELGLKVDPFELDSEGIARATGSRRLLLVLDNCEHLIDGVAEIVDCLIGHCPNVHVLLTSRETLRIRDEVVLQIPPLDCPPIAESLAAADVMSYGASQLFVSRLSSHRASFTPNPEGLVNVAAICRQLDGIPLAIEFAAARAATIGVEEVQARLSRRFDLLISGRRTALPRHQTLRAVLDWSYQLLNEQEKLLLRSVGIFSGGFTLEGAAAILKTTPGPVLLHSISSLVDKSLLVLDETSLEGRWRLLETIRAYALEKLNGAGEQDEVAYRHAAYMAEVIKRASPQSRVQPTSISLGGGALEIDDVRSAADWAFSSPETAAIGIVIVAGFVPVWLSLSLMAECRERVEQALEHLEPAGALSPRTRLELLLALGVALIFTVGAPDQIQNVLDEALATARALDDRQSQVRALWGLWTLSFNLARYSAALAAAEQLLEAASWLPHPSDRLVGIRLLGKTRHYQGFHVEARQGLEDFLRSYQVPQDGHHLQWFYYEQRVLGRAMMARVYWVQGEAERAFGEARASLAEAESTHNEISMLYPIGWALFPLSLLAGELSEAKSWLQRLSHLSNNRNVSFWRTLTRCYEAQLAIRRGEYASGVTQLSTALELCRRTGWVICYPELLSALAEGQEGCGQFDAALMTINEAIAISEQTGERWCGPELRRIKARLVRASVPHGEEEAEELLRQSLELSATQGALMFELRAAIDYAKLVFVLGRREEGRLTLSKIIEKCDPLQLGADLKTAIALAGTATD